MKITVHPSGSHRELGFVDAEDEAIVAYSGLLNRDEAIEMAARLHDVAHELESWAHGDSLDPRQGVLPFLAGLAA